ncbi:uncharacterized protein G2W53_010794 [Senna tora]|uniref:Uncharacterized protein n=1 Tax=Senna tora TaxID=362788 RepID=A0A835CC33_9FABA|nr:uncharacterized protein G2W53_010794 [Senna tora]
MASLSLSASATSPPNLILGFPPRPSIPTLNAVQIRTFASPASSTLSYIHFFALFVTLNVSIDLW